MDFILNITGLHPQDSPLSHCLQIDANDPERIKFYLDMMRHNQGLSFKAVSLVDGRILGVFINDHFFSTVNQNWKLESIFLWIKIVVSGCSSFVSHTCSEWKLEKNTIIYRICGPAVWYMGCLSGYVQLLWGECFICRFYRTWHGHCNGSYATLSGFCPSEWIRID